MNDDPNDELNNGQGGVDPTDGTQNPQEEPSDDGKGEEAPANPKPPKITWI